VVLNNTINKTKENNRISIRNTAMYVAQCILLTWFYYKFFDDDFLPFPFTKNIFVVFVLEKSRDYDVTIVRCSGVFSAKKEKKFYHNLGLFHRLI